jgi:hypothetical protein
MKEPDVSMVYRFLDLSEVKAFECQGLVHFMEKGACRPFLERRAEELEYYNPVPVLDASGKRIGFACVERSTGELARPRKYVAQVFLVKESPERLDVEQRLRPYFLVAQTIHIYKSTNDLDEGPFIPQLTGLSLLSDVAGWESVW